MTRHLQAHTLFYVHWHLTCLCEALRSPGTGVADSGELLSGCWELNVGYPEEQLVLKPLSHLSSPPYFILKLVGVRWPHYAKGDVKSQAFTTLTCKIQHIYTCGYRLHPQNWPLKPHF